MTYVYIVLVIFCLMRVVAFTTRVILANSTALGQNLVVLDKEIISGTEPIDFLPIQLIRTRRLFRAALLIAVILGVVGIHYATSSDATTASRGTALLKARIILFLVLTVLQTIQALIVAKESYTSGYRNDSRPFGDRHGSYLICLIYLLLLIREAFLTATLGNSAKQNDERLWFPLVALPEFMAVVCYSISGLVPPRSTLKQ
ncbi:hypothetical protein B0H17DRAFT_1214082 [Mycena rosella]|uniref:Uncharacterized protein n=1 Tax=Mycena rosella TaxID=1033263 RepID=A0AAD7G4F5_MYCRO|nr:hypothetical protein B0H17DRAFT_1214082 [Mycena rosella]